MKRLIDLTASVAGLLILSPVIALVAVLVRYKMGSPVIFRQQRPGLHARPFYIYKFRTLTDARDEEGNLLPDEKRLIPFGGFLRRFSLDELPQLFNLLKGDISLVGPRPLLMDYVPRYNCEQARRHDVKPGITGWAQVNGRNALSWEERFRLDVWYVDNQSLYLDFKILIRTFLKVFSGEGVSQEGFFSCPMFMGTEGSPSPEERAPAPLNELEPDPKS